MTRRGPEAGSRADETRGRILAAAVGIFSRRGYRATSMNEIAGEVGLSKPTLYHYVRSKEELLVRIYEEVLDESLRSAREIVATAPSPLQAVRGLLIERVAYTCEHQDLLKICFEEEAALPAELAEPILQRRRAFSDVVLAAVTSHLTETGLTLPMSPMAYVNTCLGAANWLYKWYDPQGPKTPRELGEEIAAVLLPTLEGTAQPPTSVSATSPR